MDLDEYLWRNRITNRSFCKIIGITPGTLTTLVKKRRNACLPTAVKIVAATNGAVTYEDLLTDKDAEIIRRLLEKPVECKNPKKLYLG